MSARVAVAVRQARPADGRRERARRPDPARASSTRGGPAVMAPAPEARHRFADIAVNDPDPGVARDARETGQAPPDLASLLARATAGDPRPLPHRAALEARLGRPLGHVAVYSGPAVRPVLAALGAEAASVGPTLLFASEHPALATVAHEVAHALQAQPGAGREAVGILPREASPEREAEGIARGVATPGAFPAPGVIGQLAPGVVALQRADVSPLGDEGAVAVLERPPERPEAPAPEPEREAETAPAAVSPAVAEASPAATPVEPAADAALPTAPELTVSPEDVAARQAAVAEAEAVMASAGDVPQLLEGFAQAPPTLQASLQAQIGQQAADLAARETQQLQDEVPELHATMSGEVAPADRLPVETPAPREVVLEATAPAPAPAPELAETPDPGRYDANADVTRTVDRLFGGPEDADRASQVGETLGAVSTTDPDIPRSAGPAPAVPLAGESDPSRLAGQTGEAVDAAHAARQDAQAAVVNGPGPERAQPTQVDEAYAVEGLAQPAITPVAPAEGAQAYLGMGLPPEVTTAFDQQQQPAMQASLAGAAAQAGQAVAERDEGRQAAVAQAEDKAAELSRGADEQQREHIGKARATIQDERQATLTAQTDAVKGMEGDVDARRQKDHDAIDTRVRDDQQAIAGRYQTAETDAGKEIAKGEREAAEKKRTAEQAAEDQSWWDKAVSFVRQAFDALVSAINTVFDGVRKLVNGILDAAKAFAMAVIDAAAGFIKGAIAAFGEFLKFAVNALLADVFPGLARALNDAIDTAVAVAQGLVDKAAAGLKAGVAALVDDLKAGLNRVLDTFQAGLNVAIGLVQAALTGDWSALARKVLEAVLQVIGVSPESFYAFIGRAEETFQIIVDNPMQFLRNLVDAFLGGVRLFADNFLAHLQAGIIGWLTGALGSAGLQLPERFDLMGVLSIAQQILGLTWDRLRQKAVKLIGEQNVARLEFVFSYIQTLVTEGWGGLWQRIQNDLGALKDQVLEGIKSFLLERVIMAAITKLASLFNPVGAIVQVVLTAWNLYTFLRDQLQRIFQVVQAVVDAIGDIARGILAPGMAKVEQVLASLLPLALDLLARLLGLGNVGAKVREIIERIQQTIDRAIDSLLSRILAAFTGKRGGTGAEKAAKGEPVGGAFEDTFQVAGEHHTLRAVVTDGQASLLMASETFGDMTRQLHGLLQNLRKLYTLPGGHFHGTAQADQFEADFTAIEQAGVALAQAVNKEKNPVQAQQIAHDGIEQLKQKFNALGLPEATFTPPATHRPDGLDTDKWGRARAFWGRPISSASRGQGSRASKNPPGLRILEHVPGIKQYQRGHLLAGTEERSLGGKGNTLKNLVPLAQESNTEMRDGAEKNARGKIYDESAHPQYIINYTAEAKYGSDTNLVALLKTLGAPDTAVERLFVLAMANADLTDTVLLHALDPSASGAIAPTPGQYIDVRKQLARAFMPESIAITIEPKQGPEHNLLSFNVLNHQGW